jgi:hypothetical protein
MKMSKTDKQTIYTVIFDELIMFKLQDFERLWDRSEIFPSSRIFGVDSDPISDYVQLDETYICVKTASQIVVVDQFTEHKVFSLPMKTLQLPSLILAPSFDLEKSPFLLHFSNGTFTVLDLS